MLLNIQIYVCFRYVIMQECWAENPDDRPTFTDLRGRLEVMMEENSSSSYLSIQVDSGGEYYSGSKSESSCDDTSDIQVSTGSTQVKVTEELASSTPTRSPSSVSSSSTWSYETGTSHQMSNMDRPRKISSPMKGLRSKRTDLLRLSTCSHDELLPYSSGSISGSDGGIVLELSSLESIGETKL